MNEQDQNDQAFVAAESPEALPIHAEPPPLRTEPGGVIRVGRSRVSLDLIVEQYENGMTPEEMAHAYDTLAPADVHAAIAYYLRHRGQVRDYLTRRKREAESLRATVESRRPQLSREELLRRRTAAEKDNAPVGQ